MGNARRASRLVAVGSLPRPDDDLGRTPNFLGQKYPAQGFRVETLLDFAGGERGEMAGLAVLGGGQHAALALRKTRSGDEFVYLENGKVEPVGLSNTSTVRISVRVDEDGACTFFMATPTGDFAALPKAFRALEGGWLGAKVGLFSKALHGAGGPQGFAEFDYFRFLPMT